ncbi:MAG TPA: CBS domain-containing protein, partial [Pirellulaceae bacterium]|nr:CBS domain-containing protein [Pirellulaceae bacterium]
MNRISVGLSGTATGTVVGAEADVFEEITSLSPTAAAERLAEWTDEAAAKFLAGLGPAWSEDILLAMPEERQAAVIAAAPNGMGRQWSINLSYPENSIGRLMEPAHAVFRPELTVAETVERIRKLSKSVLVTYGFIVDRDDRLVGIVAMRDLLLADIHSRLDSVMLPEPFTLQVDQTTLTAMRLVVNKHFPVYPVCDGEGRLVGTVRGRTLFEAQAFEISAQVGSMVGVEKEERISTPIPTSLRFRHPWLQLNLLTAFLAAGVVAIFQSTIDQLVLLAVFLPVLAGQSGNTGCQSLAVTLRGLTLGDIKSGRERRLVIKEGLLGLMNGALVGVTAGLGMFAMAWWQGESYAWLLALIVFVAM